MSILLAPADELESHEMPLRILRADTQLLGNAVSPLASLHFGESVEYFFVATHNDSNELFWLKSSRFLANEDFIQAAEKPYSTWVDQFANQDAQDTGQ